MKIKNKEMELTQADIQFVKELRDEITHLKNEVSYIREQIDKIEEIEYLKEIIKKTY